MKYVIIFALLFLLPNKFCQAEDKGWNVLYDEATGKIVELSYGDSGYQHRIDEGYKHIKVPSRDIEEGQIELDEWEYKNGKIKKKTSQEIASIRSDKHKKELKRQIIELKIRSKEAKSMGYADLENDYNTQIVELEDKLNELNNEGE